MLMLDDRRASKSMVLRLGLRYENINKPTPTARASKYRRRWGMRTRYILTQLPTFSNLALSSSCPNVGVGVLAALAAREAQPSRNLLAQAARHLAQPARQLA